MTLLPPTPRSRTATRSSTPGPSARLLGRRRHASASTRSTASARACASSTGSPARTTSPRARSRAGRAGRVRARARSRRPARRAAPRRPPAGARRRLLDVPARPAARRAAAARRPVRGAGPSSSAARGASDWLAATRRALGERGVPGRGRPRGRLREGPARRDGAERRATGTPPRALAPAVIAISPEHGALAIAPVRRPPAWTRRSAALSTRALNGLGTRWRRCTPPLPCRRTRFTRLDPERLATAAESSPARGRTSPGRAALARRRSSTSPTRAPRRVRLHGDANLRNAIADDGRVTLLDLEHAAAGPAAADLGQLLAGALLAAPRAGADHRSTSVRWPARCSRATRAVAPLSADAALARPRIAARARGAVGGQSRAPGRPAPARHRSSRRRSAADDARPCSSTASTRSGSAT